MNKKLYPFLILTIILLISTNLLSRKKYKYVGSKNCKKCHSMEAIGNQYKIWASSPHEKAWRRLKTKESKIIAKKHNITNPSDNLKCLKCHTTGKGRSEIVKSEGVGCESCHGAGEKYFEMENHVDFINRTRAYKKAISNGMFPIIGIDHLGKREKMCLRCHSKKRLCYKPSNKNRYEMPIQVIDSMKKSGKVDLSHPLRK